MGLKPLKNNLRIFESTRLNDFQSQGFSIYNGAEFIGNWFPKSGNVICKNRRLFTSDSQEEVLERIREYIWD